MRRARRELASSASGGIKNRQVSRFEKAIDVNDERETNRSFGRGNSNREENYHHARQRFGMRAKTPEGQEVQVRGVEHQFDADENDDGVAAEKRAREADRKKQSGHGETGHQ